MVVHPSDIAISAWCIIVSAAGLVCNACVLIVILNDKELRKKDYIIFIQHRTWTDIAYCIHLGILQPFAILTESSRLIAVASYVHITLAMSTILIEPTLACNRYFSIFHPTLHKKIYKTGNVLLMCAMVWVLGAMTPVPQALVGSLGRVTGFICCLMLSRDTVLVTVIAAYMPLLAVMGAVMYFNYKIYRFLRRHQNQQLTNSQRTKLQNDREMLRFIAVTAVLPFIFEGPIIIATWIQMFVPVSAWIIFAFTTLFLCVYPTNPLIALFMIKPLRKHFLRIVKRLFSKNTAVAPVAMRSNPNGLGADRPAGVDNNISSMAAMNFGSNAHAAGGPRANTH